ncbi:uncharacterized protein LOC110424342 [Herrania umbratica]|uniref:Uncharacterized protein LOC110424342 n=1 Tax=Herrania umbratica TaxID=108875 RepID=A0A6J1B7Q4_9ROSI|nr:uncharacterized protein LOC110424342 [Herrania umbratica]
MALQQIATNREEAEIYQGAALCKQKSMELLGELRLPKGLMPLDNLVEVGYNRTTGFIWLKQQKSLEYRFKAIGKTVLYEPEMTAFVEDRRMRRLTGVKSKELLIWVSISDICVDKSNPSKITFANSTGLSRCFPVAAFEAEGEGRN